jgi:hypothetical protein
MRIDGDPSRRRQLQEIVARLGTREISAQSQGASVQRRPSGAFAAEYGREIPRPVRPQTAEPTAEFR